MEDIELHRTATRLRHGLALRHEHERVGQRPERLERPARGGEHGLATRAVRRGQVRFFESHAIEGAEFFQMRRSDERDKAVLGFDHVGQRLHLAGTADAGLNDRGQMDRRVEPGQGQRHAEMVVQVALGRQHRGGAAEQQAKQILGRGLAHATRDANDRAVKFPPVFARNPLQRPERIRHDKLRQSHGLAFPADQRSGRAAGLRLAEKVVPVALARLQRDKNLAGGKLPRVLGEAGYRPARWAGPTAARPGGHFVCGESWHWDRFRSS